MSLLAGMKREIEKAKHPKRYSKRGSPTKKPVQKRVPRPEPTEIISHVEAKERGLKHFFTGQPCKRGHIAERHTNGGTCTKCSKDYNSRYLADRKQGMTYSRSYDK